MDYEAQCLDRISEIVMYEQEQNANRCNFPYTSIVPKSVYTFDESHTNIDVHNAVWSVADPGFGQGGPNWSGGPNFETGRILYRVIAC